MGFTKTSQFCELVEKKFYRPDIVVEKNGILRYNSNHVPQRILLNLKYNDFETKDFKNLKQEDARVE